MINDPLRVVVKERAGGVHVHGRPFDQRLVAFLRILLRGVCKVTTADCHPNSVVVPPRTHRFKPVTVHDSELHEQMRILLIINIINIYIINFVKYSVIQ